VCVLCGDVGLNMKLSELFNFRTSLNIFSALLFLAVIHLFRLFITAINCMMYRLFGDRKAI